MLKPGHAAFASIGSERALLLLARGHGDAALVEADRAVKIAEASPQADVFAQGEDHPGTRETMRLAAALAGR